MRIAMVSEHADPTAALGGADAGGQNVHVAALSCALAERGHLVTVYTRKDDPAAAEPRELAPGVIVRRLRAGPQRPLPKDGLYPHMPELGDRLARIWRQDPPDVVHAHFWMSGIAALRATAELAVPVVQTFHALGTVKKRHQGSQDTSPGCRADWERAIGQQADQIVATCSDEVSELAAMGVSRRRISVVPCGVNADLFRPDGPVRRRGGRHQLLTIGRLVARKGVDTILAALPGVPDAELVVAGGPAPDRLPADPEFRRLKAVARKYGVADRVAFIGGVARDQVPGLLRSADIVVCVPWYEPFGIVPLEAMACGVPVIVSAVGGLTDTVVHGSTGLHVPPRDPAALAEALTLLLAAPQARTAMGREGTRRARHWYSWDRIAAQTEAVYARLAGDAAPRAAPDTAQGAGIGAAPGEDKAQAGGTGGAW